MTEMEKYQLIYSRDEYLFYGHTNHGKAAYELVESLHPSSIIDIGCGHNEFCKHFRERGIKSCGLDLACPSADIIAAAKQLPVSFQEFDLLTSFDVLEHLPPIEINDTFCEFRRVSKRFLFSICYRHSEILLNGENLHLSVFSEDWWISKIKEFGIVLKCEGYLFGVWRPL